jgi:hypothetical protein
MHEARGTLIVVVVMMAILLAGRGSALDAGPRGYFSCATIVFFEPCPGTPPDGTGDLAASGAAAPAAGMPEAVPAIAPSLTESLWAEPRAVGEGPAGYVPPRPVREFLEAPTPERAQAYLRWNQQRLQAIARAAEMLRSVAVGETPGMPGMGPPAGSSPANGACAAPGGPATAANAPLLEDPRLGALLRRGEATPSAHGVAVIYAFASWCPSSARQTPILAAWARSRPDVPVTGLLFDSPAGAATQFDGLPFSVRAGSRVLRERLGVRGYPTILFVKDGVPVETLSSLTPAARLEAVSRALGA